VKSKFVYTSIGLFLIALLLSAPACAQKTGRTTTKPNADTKTPVNSKLFGANLIKNGGAEAENVVQWANAGDSLKTFRYDGGWGDAWQVTPPNKGEKFFYVQVSGQSPLLAFSQDFDVSEIAKEIDTDKVGYNSSAWFGVRGAAAARLKVEFYDANKMLIKRPEDADATEKITSANRPDDVTMVEKTRVGDVPTGTRKIKITLEFSLFDDASKENEGESPLADNLSFVLTKKGDR
jgi:hypothetical protein